MKKAISPLLAAVILVALVISVAFIVSSAISGMAQKQAAAAEETAKASGAMLQVDLDSVTCNKDTGEVKMVVRLLGTTKSAEGVSVVIKDASGQLRSYSNSTLTLEPGVNILSVNVSGIVEGPIGYLAISTQNPSIYAEYSNETFGNLGKCE